MSVFRERVNVKFTIQRLQEYANEKESYLPIPDSPVLHVPSIIWNVTTKATLSIKYELDDTDMIQGNFSLRP